MNRSAFALRETSRRLLSLGVVSLALAGPWALAREGVDVNKQHSGFARLVPADQVEAAAQQQFAQMASQAKAQNALLLRGVRPCPRCTFELPVTARVCEICGWQQQQGQPASPPPPPPQQQQPMNGGAAYHAHPQHHGASPARQ